MKFRQYLYRAKNLCFNAKFYLNIAVTSLHLFLYIQEASSQICNEHQSLQQLLYNLYSTVTLTEIKGYSMIQFSYLLLRLYNPGTM